jgi:hypothetical protein
MGVEEDEKKLVWRNARRAEKAPMVELRRFTGKSRRRNVEEGEGRDSPRKRRKAAKRNEEYDEEAEDEAEESEVVSLKPTVSISLFLLILKADDFLFSQVGQGGPRTSAMTSQASHHWSLVINVRGLSQESLANASCRLSRVRGSSQWWAPSASFATCESYPVALRTRHLSIAIPMTSGCFSFRRSRTVTRRIARTSRPQNQ